MSNLIEIQKDLEEKRLIYGQKLENFLWQLFIKIVFFVKNKLITFYNSKYFSATSCITIIIISIYTQSTRDIGFASAKNLKTTIIIDTICTNLLGILMLLICRQIFCHKNNLKRFILPLFAWAYFIRIYSLQFNEYFTVNSILVTLSLIYIALKLIKVKNNFEFIIIALIIYFISSNFDFSQFNPKDYFIIFKEDVFLILLFIALNYNFIKNNYRLNIFLWASILSAIATIFGSATSYEIRSLFFSFAIPLIFLTIFLLIKQQKIFWQKKHLLFLILLVIPHFEAAESFAVILNLCYFWWIWPFFNKKPLKTQYFLVFLAIFSIILIIFDNSGIISWIVCATTSFYLITKYLSNRYNDHFIAVNTIILSYIISLILAAILNYQNLYAAFLKSPNYIHDQKAFYIQNYAANSQDLVTIISPQKTAIYPLLTYLGKENKMGVIDLSILYKKFDSTSPIFIKFKSLIANKNNKLIFIDTNNHFRHKCSVEFYELYFYDTEFRRMFLENYAFLNTIKEIDDSYKIQKTIEVYIRK